MNEILSVEHKIYIRGVLRNGKSLLVKDFAAVGPSKVVNEILIVAYFPAYPYLLYN